MGKKLLIASVLAALCGCVDGQYVSQVDLWKANEACNGHDGIYRLWYNGAGTHARVFCRDGMDFLIW